MKEENELDKVIIEKIREMFEVIEGAASDSTYLMSEIGNIAKEDFINKINTRVSRIENEIKEIKRTMNNNVK